MGGGIKLSHFPWLTRQKGKEMEHVAYFARKAFFRSNPESNFVHK